MAKILIVEDDKHILTGLVDNLEMEGYKTVIARDGKEALRQVQERSPDLIILDLGLPVMNGDEVARLFKDDAKLKHIPIILISSIIGALNEKFAASGAEAFLYKPFEFDELLDLVNKYCGPAGPPAAP